MYKRTLFYLLLLAIPSTFLWLGFNFVLNYNNEMILGIFFITLGSFILFGYIYMWCKDYCYYCQKDDEFQTLSEV